MKSLIHTARFSRSKSAEKGKRNFLHHCQEFNFCKIFPLGERIFLLSFDHHEFNLQTSIFPFQPGRIGRTSVQLGPCQIEAANNGCPHFPAGFKILKYPFIDVPPSSSLQFLPPTSFNCRDWPRSSAGNPISKKRGRILWSLFHIPELGMAGEATSSDHIKPSVFRVFSVKGEGLEN